MNRRDRPTRRERKTGHKKGQSQRQTGFTQRAASAGHWACHWRGGGRWGRLYKQTAKQKSTSVLLRPTTTTNTTRKFITTTTTTADWNYGTSFTESLFIFTLSCEYCILFCLYANSWGWVLMSAADNKKGSLWLVVPQPITCKGIHEINYGHLMALASLDHWFLYIIFLRRDYKCWQNVGLLQVNPPYCATKRFPY